MTITINVINNVDSSSSLHVCSGWGVVTHSSVCLAPKSSSPSLSINDIHCAGSNGSLVVKRSTDCLLVLSVSSSLYPGSAS